MSSHGEGERAYRVKKLQDSNQRNQPCNTRAQRLTGWAEKKMSLCERIAPQTIAARIHIPACAIGAVPLFMQPSALEKHSSIVKAKTYLSIDCNTKAVLQSGLHRLVRLGGVPPRFGRALRRCWVVCRLPKPCLELVLLDRSGCGGR